MLQKEMLEKLWKKQNSPLFRKYHREMWDWLAETGSDTKSDWPGWNSHDKEIEQGEFHARCFACAVSPHHCAHCPVSDWGNGTKRCGEKNSWFRHWQSASTPALRSQYAAKIRDAWPERDDAEE